MDSSGAVTKVNVFAHDGLVARGLGTTWTYYQFDPQGSVAQRTNTTGSVTSSSKYEAYGKHVNIPGSTTDVYGWNARWGYYFDSESGLYLCQQRFYDSSQGRWLNRDPIRYAGGVNVYGYCSGGPIGGVDSTGLRGMGESLAIGLANVISKLPPWAQNILGGLGVPVAKLMERLTSPSVEEGLNELSDDVVQGCQVVGRWMGNGEYTKMIETGVVQVSKNADTGRLINHVIINGDPGAFSNPGPGTQYITFGVPSINIIPVGAPGWGNIIGGGDLFGRGLPPGMPPAIDPSPWIHSFFMVGLP